MPNNITPTGMKSKHSWIIENINNYWDFEWLNAKLKLEVS